MKPEWKVKHLRGPKEDGKQKTLLREWRQEQEQEQEQDQEQQFLQECRQTPTQ